MQKCAMKRKTSSKQQLGRGSRTPKYKIPVKKRKSCPALRMTKERADQILKEDPPFWELKEKVCTCGAKHTSFPNHHLEFCDLYKY